MPPVGAKCEVDHGGGVFWDIVTIIAHHGEKAIYEDPHGNHQYLWGLTGNFRPIKTAEQLAEEEREKEAIELYLAMQPASNSKAWDNIGDYARDRYRLAISSGYRKQ